MGAQTQTAGEDSKADYAARFEQTAPQWDAVVRPHFKFRRAPGGGLALGD
jgi:hypothetical protein